MPETHAPDAVIRAERVLPFTPAEVFSAFERPEQLAQWWGPNGFTNTFEQFEFKVGGRWVFVMHAPNGANYPNESIFKEIVPDEKIVLRHDCAPYFVLTVTLAPHEGGTRLAWTQEFDDLEIGEQLRQFLQSANEENLNRLQAVLAGETP